MSEAEQRAAVAAEALSWLGTGYHHHARIKGVGVDCAQLLIGVFSACGLVPAIETGHYPVDWHMHRSEEMFSGWLARYAKLAQDPMRAGDIVLWRFGRTFSHGSIHVGNDLLVHAYVRRGVIVSRIGEEPLDGRAMQHWSMW